MFAVFAVTAEPEKVSVERLTPVPEQDSCSMVSNIPSLSSSISKTSATPSPSLSKQTLIALERAKLE